MKVIFLDFDGVLNSQMDASMTWDYQIRPHGQGALGIFRRPVEILNEVVDQTGAVVVVSSTWRILHDLDGLCDVLSRAGFTGKVIDRTMLVPNKNRGHEIQLWLDGNDVDSYVIIDDDSDMLSTQMYNFVRVDEYTGLTPDHGQQMVEILNRLPTGTADSGKMVDRSLGHYWDDL